ncbi:MAG TPA: nucleotidyltransferase domain-containing protein [Gaiellaceae bacterium]|nr:nucleotidyltransferase domain-containing protein [Gaiellaceae bacterium]
MTERSATLRALAERVAAALPEHVTDVVLTGSTSRGSADDLSDVELLVISERLPDGLPLEELQTWAPGVEGATWYGGLCDGEKVELVWWAPAFAEERVRAIAAGEVVDHARLRTAEAIVNGVPLRGGRHADWVARLARYPDGLADRIVDDVADDWIDWLSSQRSNFRPGDALVLAQALVAAAEGILRVVFALNEEWEPGWKRLASRLEPLAIKPDRLAERIDAAIRALDLQALRTLAAETVALAPETDKTRLARERLLEPL